MLPNALAALVCNTLLGSVVEDWSADFAAQTMASRPRLEARYTDATRQSLEILGETYEIILALKGDGGHCATIRTRDGAEARDAALLWLEARTDDGRRFSSKHAAKASRINLYRRGPYYAEVHWFDVYCAAADDAEDVFPAAGEVVLHCYPEKVHIQVIWHAVEDAPDGSAGIVLSGIDGKSIEEALKPFDLELPEEADAASDPLRSEARFDALKKGDKASARLALGRSGDAGHPVQLGRPLPEGAFELLAGIDAQYDSVRGCYMIRTDNPGGFSYHYYEAQNHYETARLRIANDDKPRKVYVCHATRQHPGSVECGVILDAEGDPLPITVQISKNFAGEKEEPFYNPHDTPFSETFFPLHLGPGEAREVTTLHLYQNWGNHPLKQFSSLGAWMDYFHSSTGVTETTCFVPFKFGGLPGVSIADLRPMSQRMWSSQPQHDNVAGHRFLMVKSGGAWHYSVYRGTTYRSTGPNWMDVTFDYLSDDGKIRARLDSFELPQTDELRNFVRLHCEILAPMRIENLATDFRLLDITTRIQSLRYKHVAWQSGPGEIEVRELEAKDAAVVPGVELRGDFPWATAYGDKRGCNSFVVRRFEAKLGGEERRPALVAHTLASGDMHLALTVTGGAADLRPGDFVDAEFYMMPYGDDRNTYETPQRDRVPFGANGPRVVRVTRGEKLGDFPARIRADAEGRAEFTVAGGANAIPIIVEGLPTYKRPRLEERGADGTWTEVAHRRVGNDGYQVFVVEEGGFGCVFLLDADGKERTLRSGFASPTDAGVRPNLRLAKGECDESLAGKMRDSGPQ